jgi:hypothetical protein
MDIGVHIRSSSRANFSNCNFKKNAIGVQCDFSSNFAEDSSNTWNATGGDANDLTWYFLSGGAETTNFQGFNEFMVKKTLGSDITSDTLTGSTSPHTFQTYSTFFAGHEFKAKGYLKCKLFGVITGTAGSKTLRVQLNTTTVMSMAFAASADGDFVVEMVMHNIGSSAQRFYGWGICSDGNADVNTGSAAMAINTGSAVSLNVQGVLGAAADEIVLQGIEIWRGEH